MQRLLLTLASICAAAFAAPTLAAASHSTHHQIRGSGDDVILGIHFGDKEGRPIPGTVATGLHFLVFFDAASTSGVVQPVTLTVGLPSGLHWGQIAPQPSDGCQGTAPAVCTATTADNGGTVEFGWGWEVTADAPGTYTIAATVTPAQPDPNPANNSATFQFQVVLPTVPPTASLTFPKIARAGSVVAATLHVTVEGTPAPLSALTCLAFLGPIPVRGKAHIALSSAVCRFPTPRNAKGKRLRATVRITMNGTTISKHFTVKLR
jgi:hypothetical protein